MNLSLMTGMLDLTGPMEEINPESSNLPIVILGKGWLAIEITKFLTQAGKIVVAVPSISEPNWSPSFRQYCLENQIVVIEWENFRAQESGYLLGISVYFDRIFNQKVIDRFERLLNIHNSLLPKYRGVRPVNWALANREKVHGVTIHLIDGGIDTGPVYAQASFEISPERDEVEDVYGLCLEKGLELFTQIYSEIGTISPFEQDHSVASYYSKEDSKSLGDRVNPRR